MRRGLFVVLVVAIVVGFVFRSWIAAQARAVAVLATTLEVPVVGWTVEQVTREPRVEDVVVARMSTTLARPAGDGPWPALVFVNGATAKGRHEPHVARLARGLARAGYLVLVPDLPGLRKGAISDRTVDATVAVIRNAAARRDAETGRVALVGVSVGATLALLAAEDDRLRDRVSLVSGIAPYTDLAEVIRLATTGYHRDPARPDRLVRYETEPFLDVAVARSVVAALPPGHDDLLLLVDEDAPDPLAPLRDAPTAGLDDDARAVVDLLANRDPRRFDELYAALPAPVRDQVEGLSPLRRARRLRVPVELASAPADKYFPVAQSQALARAAPDARVTVTTVLSHAIPEPSLRDVDDVLRFDAFVVRSLREASGD